MVFPEPSFLLSHRVEECLWEDLIPLLHSALPSRLLAGGRALCRRSSVDPMAVFRLQHILCVTSQSNVRSCSLEFWAPVCQGVQGWKCEGKCMGEWGSPKPPLSSRAGPRRAQPRPCFCHKFSTHEETQDSCSLGLFFLMHQQ